ncbi:MAG: ABC transporter ATP-binding protein [Firmicutes bacterium]|nr:ABC transporter ATP-binding protein [Bacillota bacterium]
MLPLDKPTAEVLKAMSEHNIKEDDIDVALALDLNTDGQFGESWLLVDKNKMKMYCLAAPYRVSAQTDHKEHDHAHLAEHKKNAEKKEPKEFNSFTEFDLKMTNCMYVDNFVSSNRLLAYHGEHIENDPNLSEKENKEKADAIYEKYTTIVIAFCTNAKKKKLFAFVDIVGRIQEGNNITADDPLFEQFNLKCPKCNKVYADQERRICENCSNSGAVFKRLLKYFFAYKRQAIAILLCMTASSLVALINPIINGKVLFDEVIAEDGALHSEIWVYITVFVIIGMALLTTFIGIIQNFANSKLSTRVSRDMKLDVFGAMQKMSLSYFNKNRTGSLITRVNYDADKITSFFCNGLTQLIYYSVNLIGLTIFLLTLNWKLTLIVFIPVPFVVLIFKFMLPGLSRMYSKLYRRSSSVNAVLNDSLYGVRVVKAFAKETDETNRFHKYSERLYEANLQYNKISLTIFPLVSLLIGLSSKAIWGFGGIEVMNMHMTYGEFTTFFGYLGMIFTPLNFFTTFTDLVTQALNSAQRMYEVIDAIPDITDSPDAVALDPIKGDIEFKRVCFHYNPNRPILKDVSFKIHAGDHIGLVGHTGAGKSTIANLVNRLYDVVSGSVEIDGINVRDIQSQSLRRGIAIVSQEIFLFRGTLTDNIRYARPDATLDEVIAVAKAANAHEFITGLWDGYDTIVGAGGMSLSGGQRQRISIARALLLDPRILILDEATAAMDTETERQIQEALHVLVKGRTTISIAHRLSTLKDCDYIMAIENGQIAEMGTQEELIKAKGLYYRLYKLQSDAMKRVLQGM